MKFAVSFNQTNSAHGQWSQDSTRLETGTLIASHLVTQLPGLIATASSTWTVSK